MSGWRAILHTPWMAIPLLALGALAATAHVPWSQTWAMFVGFIGLAWGLHFTQGTRRPWLAGAWRAGAFGFGYFFVSVHWVRFAFYVDADRFAHMAWGAVVGLALVLALFWALAGAVVCWHRDKHYLTPFALTASFASAEWLRTWLFTGFPWNMPGMIWTPGQPISQIAAPVGVLGLTALTLFMGFSLFSALQPKHRRTVWPFAMGLILFTSGGVWGAHHISAPQTKTDITVRMVQANTQQVDKWKVGSRENILMDHLRLTRADGLENQDIIIWPEAAIPTPILDDKPVQDAINDVLHPGQILITGTYRIDRSQDTPRYFNSLVVLKKQDGQLQTQAVYDKTHLVPFGEYLPFEPIFSRLGLKQMVAVGESFSAGHTRTAIPLTDQIKIYPLICYEALFPNAIPQGIDATFAINISNDAWFGTGSGPIQHLHQTQYRAIESRTPIVRVTPTGITTLIDKYGKTTIGESILQDVRGYSDIIILQ